MHKKNHRPNSDYSVNIIVFPIFAILIVVGFFIFASYIGTSGRGVGKPIADSTSTHLPTSLTFTPYATKATFSTPTHSSILYIPVTWMQLVSFLDTDHTNWNEYNSNNYVCLDFAIDLVENARKQRIKAWVVLVKFVGDDVGHAFTGFETTDKGIVFIEPQTDIPYLNPAIGKLLCDAWTGKYCMGKILSFEYAQCDHSQNCSKFTP